MAATWFKHDYAASNDLQLVKVEQVYGWAGYGAYFKLLEAMYPNGGRMAKGNIDAFCYCRRADANGKEMVEWILDESGLFIFTPDESIPGGGYYHSRRADSELTLAAERRESERQRQTQCRARKRQGNPSRGCHAVVTQLSRGCHDGVTMASQTNIDTDIDTDTETEKKRQEKNSIPSINPNGSDIRREGEDGVDFDLFLESLKRAGGDIAGNTLRELDRQDPARLAAACRYTSARLAVGERGGMRPVGNPAGFLLAALESPKTANDFDNDARELQGFIDRAQQTRKDEQP